MKVDSRRLLLVLALLLVAVALASPAVRAEDFEAAVPEDDEIHAAAVDDDEDGAADNYDDEDEDNTIARSPARSLAVFPGHDLLSPAFPAGDSVESLIAFGNMQETSELIFFVVGHLARIGDSANAIQNFSGVRHSRPVGKGETASLSYVFTPDALLIPSEYVLVLRVFFRDDVTNETYASIAYNNTVTISEPSASDPKTFFTILTLIVIVAGAGYAVAVKVGVAPRPTEIHVPKKVVAPVRQEVEMGTGNTSYDPSFVSEEHVKYREQLLRNKSGSPKRKSASPKKRQ